MFVAVRHRFLGLTGDLLPFLSHHRMGPNLDRITPRTGKRAIAERSGGHIDAAVDGYRHQYHPLYEGPSVIAGTGWGDHFAVGQSASPGESPCGSFAPCAAHICSKKYLGFFQKFGVVLGRKRLRLLKKRGHLFVVEFGRSCGARGHRDADFPEEFLQSSRGTDADQSRGACRRVVEHMRSIGRDVDCLARMDDRLLPSKCGFDLPIQHDECFFKVMAMWPRATAGRDVHVDHTESAFCVFSIDGDGVGISDETDVGLFAFTIGIRRSQGAIEIVGRKGRVLSLCLWHSLLLEALSTSTCGPKIENANARADCDADKKLAAIAISVI